MIYVSNTIRKKYISSELRTRYWKYSYLQKNNRVFKQSYSFDEKYIYLPRNLKKFFTIFPDIDKSKTTYDYCSVKTNQEIKLHDSFSLYHYQNDVFKRVKQNHVENNTDLIISMPASAGKSYMLSFYIAYLQQKTLILVDQTMLQNQIYNEIVMNTNANIQIVKKTTKVVADINIVTIQLLMRNKNLLKIFRNSIGSVIVDEAHIIAADKISSIVQYFPAKYRLALTATPSRSDGLDSIIFDVFGDTIIKSSNPNALKVTARRIRNKERFYYQSLRTYKEDLSSFISQESIKHRIKNMVMNLLQDNRMILLALNTKKLQQIYAHYLKDLDSNITVINGNVDNNHRNEILDNIDNGKIKILIGFDVLEKGISIPKLDTIVHLCGVTTKEKTQQFIGRLTRNHPDKKDPVFIDMLFFGDLLKKEQIRLDTYKKMIKDGEKLKIEELTDFAAN